MLRKSNKFYIAVIAIVIALLLSSCRILPNSSTNSNTEINQENDDEQITLTLWHIWVTEDGSNKEPFEAALEKWQEQNPNINIEVEAIQSETYKMRLRTAIAVNEAPDIFFSWGAGFAQPFVESGKVLALDEYIDESVTEKLVFGTLDNFTYNEKIYALPISITAGVLYCNEYLFDMYDVKIPDTYEELLEAIEVFNDNDVLPMAVGQLDGWPGAMYHNVIAIRTAGIDLSYAALRGVDSFNRDEFIQSAQVLNELVKAGAFDPECTNMTTYEVENSFRQGVIAMYYTGSWNSGSFDMEDSPISDKIVAKNFPIIQGSSGDQNGFVGGAIDTFMINANTEYKDEAVKALIEITEMFCMESYLAGAGIPAWESCYDEQSKSGLMQETMELIKESDGFILAWDTVLDGGKAEEYKSLITDIFEGNITPQKFAEEMQKLNEE